MATGAHPSYIVQIGFSGGVEGSFRIDVSTLGSGDELVDGFPTYDLDPLGTYDDVSADVLSAEIDRGRENTLQNFQAGRAHIILQDTHLNQNGTAGLYNPENDSSPLAGSIVPMMALRVAAVYSGSTAELFRGLVTSWDSRPGPGNAYLDAVVVAEDLYNWLAASRPEITGSSGVINTGTAIAQILDENAFTDPAFIDLDEGDDLPAGAFSSTGGETSLGLVTGLLEAERGVFFIDKGGVATYRDRHTQSSQDVAGTVTADIHFGSSTLDVNRIKNHSRVVVEGGGTSDYTDGESAASYGRRDEAEVQTSYVTEVQAEGLASYLATRRSTPRVDTRRLTLENTTDHIDAILNMDVADRWEFVSAFGGGTVDAFVESTRHRIEGRSHTVEVVISQRPEGEPFIIGESKVGSTTDVVSY